MEHLERYGYDNFKRTLALNYFTWMVSPLDAQVKFLLTHISPVTTGKCIVRTLRAGKHHYFSWAQSLSYNFLTYMLYEYVTSDPSGREHSQGLYEPMEGNPPHIRLKNKLISQDLLNSILEYKAMKESLGGRQVKNVMELGAGYGRTAYVFLKKEPALKYIIVDIPPALYVSQRYLSSQFPSRKVFSFRSFSDYSQIREEFESSDIAFVLPSQLALLPSKTVDLFINISSLQEMRMDQIEYFFGEIVRNTRGCFYMKQWMESRIPYDNIVIRESDYPVGRGWKRLFRRQCSVQAKFFEAMWEIGEK